MKEDYVPFSAKWEKEMMKLTKKNLIMMLHDAWEKNKELKEKAAVTAWNTGMELYNGILLDPREMGSICAKNIRKI